MEKELFDICVIGGGPGGYVAAIHAAHLGAKVALVEKDKLGGTCLNRGCIPTKALVRSAEIVQEIKKAADFGVDVDGYKVNFRNVMAYKTSVVDKLVSGVEQLTKSNKITTYHGQGCLISAHMIKVEEEIIVTKKTIIATGSESTLLPVPGCCLPNVLTTDSILELDEIPSSLIIVGGSFVGVEFACVFSAFGTKVTIVEQKPVILERVDSEIGRRFAQFLSRKGINIVCGASVKAINQCNEGLRVVWDSVKGEQSIDGQMVLMATGRKPHTKELGAPAIGIKMDRLAILANERLETNIKDIYAVGDVLGKHMQAHTASYEGEIAVENALGRTRFADYDAVPSCIFATPEIAFVGISEAEAKEKDIPYNVSKFPFVANGKATAIGDTDGFIKMICERQTGRILGVHIIGLHASDLLGECTLAVQLGALASEVAHTIHAHPTLTEAVMETAKAQLEGAIHFGKIPS